MQIVDAQTLPLPRLADLFNQGYAGRGDIKRDITLVAGDAEVEPVAFAADCQGGAGNRGRAGSWGSRAMAFNNLDGMIQITIASSFWIIKTKTPVPRPSRLHRSCALQNRRPLNSTPGAEFALLTVPRGGAMAGR